MALLIYFKIKGMVDQ